MTLPPPPPSASKSPSRAPPAALPRPGLINGLFSPSLVCCFQHNRPSLMGLRGRCCRAIQHLPLRSSLVHAVRVPVPRATGAAALLCAPHLNGALASAARQETPASASERRAAPCLFPQIHGRDTQCAQGLMPSSSLPPLQRHKAVLFVSFGVVCEASGDPHPLVPSTPIPHGKPRPRLTAARTLPPSHPQRVHRRASKKGRAYTP